MGVRAPASIQPALIAGQRTTNPAACSWSWDDKGVLGILEEERARYRSYLLRLWQVEDGDPTWRASLEEPRTGRRQTFPDLEALFAYLREATAGPALFEIQDGDLEQIGS